MAMLDFVDAKQKTKASTAKALNFPLLLKVGWGGGEQRCPLGWNHPCPRLDLCASALPRSRVDVSR